MKQSHRLLAALLAVLMLVLLLPTGIAGTAEGTGEDAPTRNGGDTFEIRSCDDLLRFAAIVNGTDYNGESYPSDPTVCAVLKADIDMIDLEEPGTWTPIGSDSEHAYIGTFDGQGHTIVSLEHWQSSSRLPCVGLFGYVGEEGIVRNVCLEEPELYAYGADAAQPNIRAGAVAGYNAGLLESIQIKTSVKLSATCTGSSGEFFLCCGGIAGDNQGVIRDCIVNSALDLSARAGSSSVTCDCYIGALAGYNGGTIEHSESDSTGSLSVSSRDHAFIGGLVGYNHATLNGCENRGCENVTVTYATGANRTTAVGGIVGYNDGSITDTAYTGCGKIQSSTTTAIGAKINTHYAGAFAGWNGSNGTIRNCSVCGSASVTADAEKGTAYAGGFVGCNGGDSAKIQSCYVSGYAKITASYASGGFAGYNGGDTQILDCYVCGRAEIAAAAYCGGLVGFNNGALCNSYTCADGSITADSVGGVAGKNEGTIAHCYYDRDVIGLSNAIGDGDGTDVIGLTTEEMTGANAANYMSFLSDDETWYGGLEQNYGSGLTCSSYPHLKGFAYDRTQAFADWPPCGYFLIGSYRSLKKFAEVVNGGLTAANARLTDDFAAADRSWIPIGDTADHAYTGVFDGCGHTITALNCTVDLTAEPGTDGYAGLFGYLGAGGYVKRLGLNNPSITAKGKAAADRDLTVDVFAGAIAGCSDGTIAQCYVAGTGKVEAVGFSACSGTARVRTGGLVGNNDGTIQDCYSFGTTDVTADVAFADDYEDRLTDWDETMAGGLVGRNDGSMENCYSANKGEISAAPNKLLVFVSEPDRYAGSSDYAIDVKDRLKTYAGALAGFCGDALPEFCYYDQSLTDLDRAVGDRASVADAALTTEQMTAGTYATDDETEYVSNMPVLSSEYWLVKQHESGYHFYPHLRGFAYDSTADIFDWPGRCSEIESVPHAESTVTQCTLKLMLEQDAIQCNEPLVDGVTIIREESNVLIGNIPAGTTVLLRAVPDQWASDSYVAVWEREIDPLSTESSLSTENPFPCLLTEDTELRLRFLRGRNFLFVEYAWSAWESSGTMLKTVEVLPDYTKATAEDLARITNLATDAPAVFTPVKDHDCYLMNWSDAFLVYYRDEGNREAARNAFLERWKNSDEDLTVRVNYEQYLRFGTNLYESGTVAYEERDGEAILTAIPNTGYTFDHWVYWWDYSDPLEDPETLSAENPYRMPLSERRNGRYIAYMNSIRYRLTVQANDDAMGRVTGSVPNANAHWTYWIEATPVEGYRFVQWTCSGTDPLEFDKGKGDVYTPAAWIRMPANDLTVTAVFEPRTDSPHTVTVVNGTADGAASSSTRYSGYPVTIAADAPEDGKIFAYWEGADGLTFEAGSESTPTATFTAPDWDVTLTAHYQDAFVDTYYLDVNGDRQEVRAQAINGDTTELTAGWYVVACDTTVPVRMFVSGDVRLILSDGKLLKAGQGITVNDEATFRIYAQTTDEATMGSLLAEGAGKFKSEGLMAFAAVIGSNGSSMGDYTSFTIIINGGRITARGDDSHYGAGIGGGYASFFGVVMINGGIVTATGGFGAAGIGGGSNGEIRGVIVNGGTVVAVGNHFGGAGIGNGCNSVREIRIVITDGIKSIRATRGIDSDCIGTTYDNFEYENAVIKFKERRATEEILTDEESPVLSDAEKEARFVDFEEGDSRYIYPKTGTSPVVLYGVRVSAGTGGTAVADTVVAAAGETVTLTAAPEEWYRFKEWTSADGLTFAPDAQAPTATFTMPESAVTVAATFIQKPQFTTHSLSLDGKIGVNFYMLLPEDDVYSYTDSKMTFTITHGGCTKEVAFDPAATPTNAKGHYRFTCYVSSLQMAETITATFRYLDGENEIAVTNTFSVKDYFDYYDKHKDDTDGSGNPLFPEKTANLIQALKNYGFYAQRFLIQENALGTSYALVTEPYDGMKTTVQVTRDKNLIAFTKSNWQNQFSKITYSLRLDSDTTINVFFTLKSGVTEMPAVTLDGVSYTPVEENGRYVVRIENIPAHLLGAEHVITAGDAIITLSALSYALSMIDEASKYAFHYSATEEDWQNAACALYTYAFYAAAYVS